MHYKLYSSYLTNGTVLQIFLLVSALLIILEELWAFVTERAQYVYQWQHWFQLLLSFLAFSTAVLQLRFLSVASVCVYKVKEKYNKKHLDPLAVLLQHHLMACMNHPDTVQTGQLHQLPRCCLAGRKVFSVCCTAALSACSKSKYDFSFIIL